MICWYISHQRAATGSDKYACADPEFLSEGVQITSKTLFLGGFFCSFLVDEGDRGS